MNYSITVKSISSNPFEDKYERVLLLASQLKKIKITIKTEVTDSSLFVYGEKITLNSDEIDQLLKVIINISQLLPNIISTFSNYEVGKKVWQTLIKGQSDYSQLNFWSILGHLSAFNIYPSKKVRDKYFLPLPDEFYLKIPAENTYRLESENLIVQLVDDFDDHEKLLNTTKSAVEYFVSFLKAKGLFKKLDINNWRVVNRDLLEKSGFRLPEWEQQTVNRV